MKQEETEWKNEGDVHYYEDQHFQSSVQSIKVFRGRPPSGPQLPTWATNKAMYLEEKYR